MRNTKYLFDEKTMTPVGMVSISQLQTFMACKKKWSYNYIEEITPRVERAYLSIGKLCHRGMQVAMTAIWKGARWEEALDLGVKAVDAKWQDYINATPLLNEEIPDMEQMLLDARSVFMQAFREFEPWKYEVLTLYDKGRPIPALELHFKVPCTPSKGLHGYIDAILKEKASGCLWCTDYKFRKQLSPDEDEAFNIQNAVYSYACQKMGINITGTMTWQHCNTPAADPQILKDGKISRAKIKTTWEHFAAFCKENGQDPTDYEEEMKEKLAGIEWFRPTYEYRNPETVQRIWNESVIPATKELMKAYNKNAVNYRSLYPWNCAKMCQYGSLCQAELRGYDAQAIRDREFVKRIH